MKRNKINEAIRTTNSISLDEKDYFRSVPIIQALKIRLGPFTSVAILIFFSPNAVNNGSSMAAKLLNHVHVISCISPETLLSYGHVATLLNAAYESMILTSDLPACYCRHVATLFANMLATVTLRPSHTNLFSQRAHEQLAENRYYTPSASLCRG